MPQTQVGICTDRNNDWEPVKWVNLWNQIRFPFGRDLAYDYKMDLVRQDGAPTRDCWAFIQASVIPDFPQGVFKYSIRGSQLTWANNAQRTGIVVDQARGIETGNVSFQPGTDVLVKFINVDQSKPFEFRLICPGYALDSKQIYRDEYIKWLKQFDGPIRPMEGMRTNTSHIVDFAKRTPTTATQTDEREFVGMGISYEYVVELAIQTGRPLYWNVSESVSVQFMTELARFLKDRYPKDMPLYLAFGNELWNFPTFKGGNIIHDSLAPTVKNQLFSMDPYDNVYEFVGLRSVQLLNAFMAEGWPQDRIRLILEGQLGFDHWLELSLGFIAKKWGAAAVPNIVWAVAGADYVEATSPRGAGIKGLFESMNAYYSSFNVPAWSKLKSTGAKLGVNRYVAYESGQALIGDDPLFRTAQDTPEMYNLYRGLYRDFGGAFSCHFSSIGRSGDGRFGYWAAQETLTTPTAKTRALVDFIGGTVSPQPPQPPIDPPPVNPPTPPVDPNPPVVTKQRTAIRVTNQQVVEYDDGNKTIL